MPKEQWMQITTTILRQIQDRANGVGYAVFVSAIFPQSHGWSRVFDSETEYTKRYHQMQTDFLGFLGYCDTTQLQSLALLLSSVKEDINGNDG